VVLPLGLKRGMWVDLSERDLRALRSLVGARSQHGAGPPRRDGHGGGKNQNNRRRAQRGRGADRGPDTRAPGGDNEFNEFAAIPNPLQQTYDRRAIREARQPRREISEDGPIPNPLEQTYDKRFVQKQRGPLGGARHKGGGEGKERQPDPMQTSVGYIGADAFHRKMAGGGGGGGGGGRGRRRR
jgi:23S rRNA pseudouridine2605 synthase